MYQKYHVTAVIVGAGASARMGFDKLFYKVQGTELLRLAVEKFDRHPYVDSLVFVAGENLPAVQALLAAHPPQKPLQIVKGGAARTLSVQAGVQAAVDALPQAGTPLLAAVHDAARPFASEELIARTIQAAAETGAAAPGVPVKDTIKDVRGGFVQATPPRAGLAAVQTPQVFYAVDFLAALAALPPADYPLLTDDCMVMERAGRPVRIVEGEYENYKVTTPGDLPAGPPPEGETAMLRIGHGYDVHCFAEGRKFILGGVDIPYAKGLLGHSDADVLAHAVTDALLGGAALGDIGKLFPDSDGAYKGADSLLLLQKAALAVRAAGYAPQNIDATVLCQAPKLRPYIDEMRENLARAAGLPAGAVSVKATTEEGLGFTGSGQGVAAHCVALLYQL